MGVSLCTFFFFCFALPRDAVIQRVGTLLTVTQEFKLSYWLSRHFSFKCNKAVRSLNSCEIQWLKWHYNLHFNVVQVTILTFRAIRWLFYLYWYLWFFLFSAIPFINSIAEVHTVLKTELFYHFEAWLFILYPCLTIFKCIWIVFIHVNMLR